MHNRSVPHSPETWTLRSGHWPRSASKNHGLSLETIERTWKIPADQLIVFVYHNQTTTWINKTINQNFLLTSTLNIWIKTWNDMTSACLFGETTPVFSTWTRGPWTASGAPQWHCSPRGPWDSNPPKIIKKNKMKPTNPNADTPLYLYKQHVYLISYNTVAAWHFFPRLRYDQRAARHLDRENVLGTCTCWLLRFICKKNSIHHIIFFFINCWCAENMYTSITIHSSDVTEGTTKWGRHVPLPRQQYTGVEAARWWHSAASWYNQVTWMCHEKLFRWYVFLQILKKLCCNFCVSLNLSNKNAKMDHSLDVYCLLNLLWSSWAKCHKMIHSLVMSAAVKKTTTKNWDSHRKFITGFSLGRSGGSDSTPLWLGSLLDTLIWHSGKTLLLDTLIWHSGKTLLLDTLIWHSGKTLLLRPYDLVRCLTLWFDTLVRHSCLTLWFDTLVRHSCLTLW